MSYVRALASAPGRLAPSARPLRWSRWVGVGYAGACVLAALFWLAFLAGIIWLSGVL